MRGTLCSEEEASQYDTEAAQANVALHKRGRRNHFAEEPVLQLQGPLLPVLASPGMIISSHHQS